MSGIISRRQFIRWAGTASVALLAACRGEPSAPSETGEATTAATAGATQAVATTVEDKPLVEITVAHDYSGAGIAPDAPAPQLIGEATRTKIKLQLVGEADWQAKQQTMLATDQVPDIMRAGPEDVRDFADPAILQPIMPLVDKYAPNLKRYLETYPQLKRWVINGEHYVIPVIYFNRWRYAPMANLRRDWMEALGLPAPTTWDEVYTTMVELKKAHPDAYWTQRGGLKRTLMLMAYPMGSGLGGWFRGKDVPYFDEAVEGGKWLYGPVHEEFKPVLDYFARAYKDGIMDPDAPTTTTDQWHEMNSSDRGFFTYDNFTFIRRWLAALRETNPEATWAPVATPEGARGKRQNDFFTFESGWVIGANTKDPQRVIEVMDYLVTPEGIDVSNWGREGVDYTLTCPRAKEITDYTREGLGKAQDPKCREMAPDQVEKVRTGWDRKSALGTGLGNLCLLVDGAVLLYQDPPDKLFDEIAALTASDPGLHEELIVPPFTKEESQELRDIQAKLDTIVNPALDKVVIGSMSLAEYDQVVEDLISAGAPRMEEIYNEAEARMA